MTMINVVNQSSLVSDADVHLMTRACARQLRHQLAPAWGLDACPVVYRSSVGHCEPGSWVISVLDDADEADALGWHTESQGGLVYGRVFARPVLDNGGGVLDIGEGRVAAVSSVLSHEVLETAVDPWCNRWAMDADGGLWAVEVCDPVESDGYAVDVGGVLVTVSDFVLPAWFDAGAGDGQRSFMDFCDLASFEVAAGGYAIRLSGGEESAVCGESYPEWRKGTKLASTARSARRGLRWS